MSKDYQTRQVKVKALQATLSDLQNKHKKLIKLIGQAERDTSNGRNLVDTSYSNVEDRGDLSSLVLHN